MTEVGVDATDFSTEVGDHATLVLVAGPTPGQVFVLSADSVIGRDETADIRVDDPGVSRRHARLLVDGDRHVIEDLGSSNGTFVNGARISRHPLVTGDRVQLGPRILLRFVLDDAETTMLRQLFESSTRDPLTGAYNKKYITERLAAEVAHADRHRSSLQLVFLDLDRFKQVNDVHGHLVGDAVLRAVADRVHSLIRTEDVFARFGGEEFVLVSRDCDAVVLAERLRAAVEALSVPTKDGPLRVTVSLGVARFDELGTDRSAAALLEIADRRLLRAKRAGRNQVCSRE